MKRLIIPVRGTHMRIRRAGALVLTLVVGVYACRAVAAAPQHFLWKIRSPAGTEAYLLGSIHVLTKRFYPLGPAVEEAFAKSRTLVEEVDLDEMNNPATMMGLLGKAMLPQGQTLEQV